MFFTKTKADGSRLIPRKHTETVVLLSIFFTSFTNSRSVACYGFIPLLWENKISCKK